LNWLVSLTSASFFSNWIIIAFTNWRFHCALKAQNDPLFTEIYAWKSSLWPLAPAWLMLISVFLLVCCLVAGIDPIVSSLFPAEWVPCMTDPGSASQDTVLTFLAHIG
jgi:amino acid transporter